MNMMKTFLIITAFLEAATGLALLVVPVFVVKLLLGAEISGVAIALGRVAGIALLALGIASWQAGGDTKSRAARGLVTAMLLYNFGVAAILGIAGLQSQPIGSALWPAVILHGAMAGGCISCLRRKGFTKP
jgi:hypothetical protein